MAQYDHSKAVLRKCVFKRRRKPATEKLDLIAGDRSFQIVGAATLKARVASMVFIVFVSGSASRLFPLDRNSWVCL